MGGDLEEGHRAKGMIAMGTVVPVVVSVCQVQSYYHSFSM